MKIEIYQDIIINYWRNKMKDHDLEEILIAIEDRIQVMEMEQHKSRKLLQMTIDKLKTISTFIESLTYDLLEEPDELVPLPGSSMNKVTENSLSKALFDGKYKVKVEDLEEFSQEIQSKLEELKEFEEELKKNKDNIVANILGEA